MYSKKLLFILIFYSSFILAQQQRAVFEHYSTESVLSSALVRGMMQDNEGYLWFGTQDAIHRFDGFNFKTFKNETKRGAVIKGYVNDIFEDRNGYFWVGVQGGLFRFDRRTGEFIQYQLENPAVHFYKFDIQSVYEDRDGVIWVGSMMGMYNVDSTNILLKAVAPKQYKDFISNTAFRSIVEDETGCLWFGSSAGLLKYNKKSDELTPVWTDPNSTLINNKVWNSVDFAIQSIFKDNSGILWAGSLGGTLLKLNLSNNNLDIYNLKDTVTLEKFPVQEICREDESKLWIATYSGLLLVDKSTGVILEHYVYNDNNKEGIGDNKLTSVLKDKSGTLWVGSLTGGLNKLNRTKIPFRNIIKKSWAANISYSQVPFSDMIITKSGFLLAGTDNGIEEFKPEMQEAVLLDPKAAINGLMEDKSGNIWIAVKQYSGGGLFKKDKSGILNPITDASGGIINKEIQCFYEASNGRIFFATDFNLFEVDLSKNTSSLIYQTNKRIYRIGEDVNNVLCLGTISGGLIFFNTDDKTVIKNFIPEVNNPNSLSDNSVTEIYLDSKNRLWIGTSTGLNKYIRETNGFKLYDDKYGLANKLIYKIMEDNSGNLWLGTERGISKFNPEAEVFKNYDVSYGLVEGPHYIGSKSKNGEMFFKARTGITYFYPDSIKDNSFIPPIVITELKVFNNPYPISNEIELSYSENYISLEFAALSYISAEKNMYEYKMEGVDKEWVNSGNRRYASYTSLAPGNYTFRVKGSNNDGVWNNEGAMLNIRILPPWYKTYWAYAVYLMLFVFAVYSWRRYDLKRQNLKYQLKMEHENAEKQEEISKMKTRFFTNISHEFRTPLTLIIGPAEHILSSTNNPELQKNAGLLKRNAMHLLGLVNQLLDISKLDEGKLKLKASFGELVSFVKGIVMLFENYAENKDIVLKVKSDSEELIGYFDKEKIEKILINIISNAIKFTPEGGKITVTVLSIHSNKVIIKVKDNGIGIPADELSKLFDRFYQVDSSHTREHGGTGIGLALTKELVELHKGTITVDSLMGEWTEFSIEIPIGSEYYSDKEICEGSEELPYERKYPDIIEPVIHKNGEGSAASSEIKLDGSNESIFEEKQILLIVEDNEDVREYIKDSLAEDYIIEEAVNGEQGLRKAESIIPDLIVSDIMMPKMDGYEMTIKLRTDEKTNHIPILLLTAKSDIDSKLEGYGIGADAYMIKPFDTKELKVRISNLIKLRKQLQEKFSRAERISFKGEEKKLSYQNEVFINKVIDIMEKHIAEEEFSIEEFGKELCMSRTQLHRKLKALTGKSASRYLRSFRLALSKKMIEEGKGNISEISYSVGFSSPIYFSKCFREEFGKSPSEILAN